MHEMQSATRVDHLLPWFKAVVEQEDMPCSCHERSGKSAALDSCLLSEDCLMVVHADNKSRRYLIHSLTGSGDKDTYVVVDLNQYCLQILRDRKDDVDGNNSHVNAFEENQVGLR